MRPQGGNFTLIDYWRQLDTCLFEQAGKSEAAGRERQAEHNMQYGLY